MNNERYLAQQLRVAILTSQLHLAVQPKFCLKTNDLVGYEVLLQWDHPTHGYIQADKWVSLAERHGLMPQLSLWLVGQVCTLIRDRKLENVPLAINMSPSCLDVTMAQVIIDKLCWAKVNPTCIEIEITESTNVQDFASLAKAIMLLRQHGVTVSLDDFGIGFSSMNYLVELEVDQIKIDKSFIHKAPHNKTAYLTLKSMIDLAKAIDLQVICEGIETEQQLQMVKELGADQGQGFLYARPQRLEKNDTALLDNANDSRKPQKIA